MCVTCLFFSELSVFSKVISKVTAWHDIDDQIQVFTVLECKVHINEETNELLISIVITGG